MGSYKIREVTRTGIKVTLEIPDPSEKDGQAKQEIKKMLILLLRERMRASCLKGSKE